MGGMVQYGLTPGPFLFRDHPGVVWAVIASMLVGNVLLLILNIPLISIWIQILRVRYSLLAPAIAVLTMVGSYSITNNVMSLWITTAAGVVGYLLRKLDMPLAPLVLTLVVGPILESNLRQALQISAGSAAILVSSPISMILLAAAAAVVAISALRAFMAAPSRVPSASDED